MEVVDGRVGECVSQRFNAITKVQHYQSQNIIGQTHSADITTQVLICIISLKMYIYICVCVESPIFTRCHHVPL